MNVLGADIGVIGEGEKTMCELAYALCNNLCLNDISGIIFWHNRLLKRTNIRPDIANIDNIPFMDFDGFAYPDWLETVNHAGIIHSARSCAFQCTFCFKSTGNRYRQRSLDGIFDEIDFQLEP